MTPPEHAGERDRLEHVGRSLGLGLSVGQIECLIAYRDQLLKWNAVYNLSAQRDADAMLTQHLIDCLSVVPALRRVARERRAAPGRPLRIADVGSGAGLPGAVIAIAEPQWQVDCIDAVGKKAAFIRQVSAELALARLSGRHARIEDWHRSQEAAGGYDIVTSRAFASLADFVRLSGRLLAPDGVWAAMKGVVPHAEIAALPPSIVVFHVEPLALPGLDLQRCLVWMKPQP